MPIYEYRCAECGSAFELLLSMSTNRTVGCPSCGSGRVEKLFSSFAHRSSGSPGGGAKSGGGAKFGCGTCSGKSCSSCR
jgi:putative FmdB family regulatory protein